MHYVNLWSHFRKQVTRSVHLPSYTNETCLTQFAIKYNFSSVASSRLLHLSYRTWCWDVVPLWWCYLVTETGFYITAFSGIDSDQVNEPSFPKTQARGAGRLFALTLPWKRISVPLFCYSISYSRSRIILNDPVIEEKMATAYLPRILTEFSKWVKVDGWQRKRLFGYTGNVPEPGWKDCRVEIKRTHEIGMSGGYHFTQII